ncbi:MAG: bifunctional 23S rRNA (guanine(2069)-N(7))-methyltransferase RlmK/23S rRNA (guanine(2445)-N(2))-methyltransferase RlmL, partial [Eggerthellaceae bacterium]|nr:bifunctional 23S rRNA (guanine(2069)-N(7))-methyltransferase RlmK/23S rRNA (guanine(2445)-N(2))-methyltransferase RlmL [Eggerthellaceae bacterium]
MNETQQLECFARCASGFESILADELRSFGLKQLRPLQGGVAFFGEKADAYRACLWSRVATRIQLVLARVDARDAEELYDSAVSFAWEEHLRPGASIAIHAHGTNDNLRNSQFSALKVKDALCDRLKSLWGERPNVDTKQPDCAIDLVIHKSRATLYLNLSGESLHKRGYRKSGQQTLAPLKETLAAGILLAAAWPALCADALVALNKDAADKKAEEAARGSVKDGLGFVDPMCGSGTLAIEAALIASDAAPGLLRSRWGCEGWLQHDEALWAKLIQEAQTRWHRGVETMKAKPFIRIVAADISKAALAQARENAARAGVAEFIQFYEADAAHIESCLYSESKTNDASATNSKSKRGEESKASSLPPKGLLACNPPYGVRMQAGQLEQVHAALSSAIDAVPATWQAALITSDTKLDAALGQSSSARVPCYNGPLQTTIYIYTQLSKKSPLSLVSLQGRECTLDVFEQGSAQFAARLRKVAKERMKWARKEGVSCFRLYDADLPDYACAIDVYEGVPESNAANVGDGFRTDKNTAHDQAQLPDGTEQTYLRVVEYQAPASVNPGLATRRFADALRIVPAVFDVAPEQVFSKVRKREKGGGQYSDVRGEAFTLKVKESSHYFEVDLQSHIDTGLFLDHRITRSLVGSMAPGTRFLNLFAYTGTATVYAASAGALSTTTVDLSQTYLNWARRNMETNGFTGSTHHYVHSDAFAWLEAQARAGVHYDLIFCDPPTFSNSKAMARSSFDVQRDHANLLRAAASVLEPGGTIIFSCNLRNFKIDADGLK